MKNILQLTALSTAVALAGCGGGGGDDSFYGPKTPTPTTPTTPITPTPIVPAPSIIAISQAKASLSTGGDSVEITFRVLDAKGGAISGAPVSLAITDAANSGASLSTSSSLTTDSTGLVTTILTLASNKVDYRINHDIILTATSTQGGGTATQVITIPAVGTTLKVASDVSSLAAGQTASVTVTAFDAKGQALVNADVNLLDGAGVAVGTTKKTGTNGIAQFSVAAATVSANASGQLNLSANVVGSIPARTQASDNTITLAAQSVNQDLSFLPSTSTSTEVNNNATIAVQVIAATSAALVGKSVTFVTTQGTFSSTSAPIVGVAMNTAGKWVGTATTTLTSTSPGTPTITALFGANSVTGGTEFVSSTPKTVTLQSDVSVLAPGGSTQIVTLVKDVNGAPVKNATVNFTISADPSGGKLSAPLAKTDASGQASVTYTAGASSTLSNAVQITAKATSVNGGAAISTTTALKLTVAEKSAFITIAQNNLLDGDTTPVFYIKDFAAAVVDIVGKPVVNQLVSVALIPKSFKKGFYTYDNVTLPDGSKAGRWVQHVTVTCPSVEFPNPVTLLANGSVAGVTANFISDADGKFDYKARYGKNYAAWLELTMTASTRVATKDNETSLIFRAPALASDFDDAGKVSPPNVVSPYGTNSVCTDYE